MYSYLAVLLQPAFRVLLDRSGHGANRTDVAAAPGAFLGPNVHSTVLSGPGKWQQRRHVRRVSKRDPGRLVGVDEAVPRVGGES